MEDKKNFNGRMGHFHQCPVTGAFINKAPSQTMHHQKQLQAVRDSHQQQINEMQDEIAELKKMVQSLLKKKSKE